MQLEYPIYLYLCIYSLAMCPVGSVSLEYPD